jgi:creatinine amidohydrolase
MSRAVKDYHPGKGPFSREPTDAGVYSVSGVYGDPTLATRAKGERFVEALVSGVLADIQALRRTPEAPSVARDGGVPADAGVRKSSP